MIPKEQKGLVMTTTGDLTEPVPLLDLGKKLSVPQDLMMEELSLRNNRGSLLFQKRQRRVQKFTFEFAASPRAPVAGSAKEKVTGTAEPGMVANSSEGQNYRSELHIFPTSGHGGPEDAQPTAARPVSAHSPSALAPGYAEPLKGVPPEKFNHTAIPKGYSCPWQEFLSYQDHLGEGRSHTPSLAEYRNFNNVLLFVKNAPLAWAGLRQKVEGPQRGGHSPALLAPAQATHGDCVCLARPGDQAL
ncbi:myozenin-3 isoform X2 [Lagenorhynchus albirostris]|uniref:myozenin-3 isoform X2 n=1 Tax=Lagenorhynchus albirostris TaxID=27610 RepID=UPI0028EC319E|nr:myozenin-3 isoform X2 [Lagenorhynchus albirostris]